MNDKTKRVFNGWLSLTIGERQELEATIRRFNTFTEPGQGQLRESTRTSIRKMDISHLGTGCACCGR